MPKTVDQIIADLGGPAAIAEALPISDGAVRLWKHRKVIPRSAWPDLIKKFPTLTIDQLLASESKRG